MVKNFFRLLVGVFGAVLAVLLSLQVAPGTMNTVVIIGVAGFFVVLVILIMAGSMVVSSRNQAETLVRISERALESQVRTAAISRAGRSQLDRFLEAEGWCWKKRAAFTWPHPATESQCRWKKRGLVRKRWII
ncbi:MAG TPA: hypothetical protein VH186_35390 [Chloroflexia bacterium]|nr:hypothetical protein [Chloroflexia bacterium]